VRQRPSAPGRSVKRAICFLPFRLSEAGTPPARAHALAAGQSSQAAIAWMVLPRPSRRPARSVLRMRDAACLALIGQQRMAQQIETCSAVLDLREKCCPCHFARALPAQPVEPRREVARHPNPAADGSRPQRAKQKQAPQPCSDRNQGAIRFRERSEPATRRAGVAAIARMQHQCRRCGATAIQEDLDAWRAPNRDLTERLGAALLQRREHALNVLARPRPFAR